MSLCTLILMVGAGAGVGAIVTLLTNLPTEQSVTLGAVLGLALNWLRAYIRGAGGVPPA